jgi:hypothetical protein
VVPGVGAFGACTYLLGGALNCGKGQPGQVAPVSHGCPSAVLAAYRSMAALTAHRAAAAGLLSPDALARVRSVLGV